MPKFINIELKSGSESDLDLDWEKIGTKLEKSGSDSDSE